MVIFPCFKYLSLTPPDRNIVMEFRDDNVINDMCSHLQDDISEAYEYFNTTNMNKKEIYKNIYLLINNILDTNINKYNSFKICRFYIWHDCTMRIRVDKDNVKIHGSKFGKSYSIPDDFEYDHIIGIVNQCMNKLKNEGVDIDNFYDDIFLVFIDIMVRGEPSFIIYPEDYSDEDYDDSDYFDD